MKLILVGASGFIGGGVLRRALALPAVSAVVVLARRPLDGVSHPKLRVVLHTDFGAYPDEVLKEAATADACIW
jgi:uncharacterized protein YbjT (DUF2867 family)